MPRHAMAQICHILVIILYLISITALRLSAIDCACPEDQLVYECSVTGGFATVWRGSAFDCGLASNEIILRHSRLNPVAECSNANGHLVAQIVEAINDTFTSQLNVTVSEDMNNKTIECAIQYENGTVSVTMTTIIIVLDPDLIINKIHRIQNNMTHLNFNWLNEIVLTMPYYGICSGSVQYYYEIYSINCGECPKMTTDTNAVCALPIEDNTRGCTFYVQSQVCGYSTGNASITIPKVPDAPEIEIFPHCNNGYNNIINTTITMSYENQTINISNGIQFDGSPIRYTITYSGSSNEKQCGSAIIEASSDSCEGNICTHTFDVSSSSCSPSTDISVSVFATNILGDGPHLTHFIQACNTLLYYTTDTVRSPWPGQGPIIVISTTVIIFMVLAIIIPMIVILIILLQRKAPHNIFSQPHANVYNADGNQQSTDSSHCSDLKEDSLHQPQEPSCIYADVCQKTIARCATVNLDPKFDDRIVYTEINHSVITATNNTLLTTVTTPAPEINNIIDLDMLLIQLRPQASPKWYHFGLAVGISKEVMDKYSDHPDEECLVEVLDCWLRNHESRPTWKEVAEVLREIDLKQLADDITRSYVTGRLPIQVDMND